MNILPKKRWHVRTRENIARVRKDEANAAEEERKRQRQIAKAEKEARLNFLRKKARSNKECDSWESTNDRNSQGSHINLFYELEQDYVTDKSNPEYEKEKKLEKEKYEKQIGYLTYLGQDTNEITGNVSWYNKDPDEKKTVVDEVSKEAKAFDDPLRQIRKYMKNDDHKTIDLSPKKESKVVPSISEEKSFGEYRYLKKYSKEKKSKKPKRHKKKKRKKKKYSSDSQSSDSSDIDVNDRKRKKVNLENMRAERLKRELEERKRAELLLQKLKGETKDERPIQDIEQKYNSQFNPHLAKQNTVRK